MRARVRPAGDPVDGDPGDVFFLKRIHHLRSSENLPLAKALSVSPHSGADGLVHGELSLISSEF